MSYVVAIANEKGGVAKTTTALSLGAALAELGQRVALVDLDAQANLTLSLGFKPGSLNRTISDMLLGDDDPEGIRKHTDCEGLTLFPASSDLTATERFVAVREYPEKILAQGLEKVQEADFMLLDCPPALGLITRNALAAAELLIIPTQCEFFSASALSNVLDLIRDIRARLNSRLRYRLLVTMLDRRNRIHRTLFNQVQNTFAGALFDTVIEIDTRLRESPIFGQPITTYAPNSRGAKQYRALAEELRTYAQEVARRPS